MLGWLVEKWPGTAIIGRCNLDVVQNLDFRFVNLDIVGSGAIVASLGSVLQMSVTLTM